MSSGRPPGSAPAAGSTASSDSQSRALTLAAAAAWRPKSARRRCKVSMVGVAPGGASSFFTEALRSSTQSLPRCCSTGRSGKSCGRFPVGRRLWHKNGVMTRPGPRRPSPPLDESKLNELALRYVGRFATTRAKLRSYLARKVRERGWDGAREPDPVRIAERFAEQGYVDDAAYALAKSEALTGRGYGKRRVVEKLRAAGVEEDDGAR